MYTCLLCVPETSEFPIALSLSFSLITLVLVSSEEADTFAFPTLFLTLFSIFLPSELTEPPTVSRGLQSEGLILTAVGAGGEPLGSDAGFGVTAFVFPLLPASGAGARRRGAVKPGTRGMAETRFKYANEALQATQDT